jgi:hypothetical protein
MQSWPRNQHRIFHTSVCSSRLVVPGRRAGSGVPSRCSSPYMALRAYRTRGDVTDGEPSDFHFAECTRPEAHRTNRFFPHDTSARPMGRRRVGQAWNGGLCGRATRVHTPAFTAIVEGLPSLYRRFPRRPAPPPRSRTTTPRTVPRSRPQVHPRRRRRRPLIDCSVATHREGSMPSTDARGAAAGTGTFRDPPGETKKARDLSGPGPSAVRLAVSSPSRRRSRHGAPWGCP